MLTGSFVEGGKSWPMEKGGAPNDGYPFRCKLGVAPEAEAGHECAQRGGLQIGRVSDDRVHDKPAHANRDRTGRNDVGAVSAKQDLLHRMPEV